MLIHGNSYYIPLADSSIHCAITSIPYWGLRDYGLEPQIWGGRRDCQHEWESRYHNPNPHGDNGVSNSGLEGGKSTQAQTRIGQIESGFCIHCNAWRGSLGLEPTPALFVANIVAVFREVWRVLRPDGNCWLNIGDSYATSANGRSAADTKAAGNDDRTFRDKPFNTAVGGLKSKDLCGIPWRVAFALQEAGWYLRSDIIWSKVNPMPESVSDRPTKSHEYVFLLTKQERYFYDQEAVREEAAGYSRKGGTATYTADGFTTNGAGSNSLHQMNPTGRNRRSVWSIATESYSGAHYATFPTKLVEPMILAGTSQYGTCSRCGSPWVRVVEKSVSFESGSGKAGNKPVGKYNGTAQAESGSYDIRMGPVTHTTTTGWHPTCTCDAPTIPAIVLDPFAGSGTVGEVCRNLGRRFVGIDLNPTYLAINALPRAEGGTSQKAIDELPLFAGLVGG